MTTTSLINTLLADSVTRLETELVTDVSDDTKVALVNQGELRQEATSIGLAVSVRTGDDQWPHVLNVRGAGDGITVNEPYEIGGGRFWRRRFVAEFHLYFPSDTARADAQSIAQIIMSRAEVALERPSSTYWFTTTPDSFGEAASESQVCKSYQIEGGIDGQWESIGTLYFEFITEKL